MSNLKIIQVIKNSAKDRIEEIKEIYSKNKCIIDNKYYEQNIRGYLYYCADIYCLIEENFQQNETPYSEASYDTKSGNQSDSSVEKHISENQINLIKNLSKKSKIHVDVNKNWTFKQADSKIKELYNLNGLTPKVDNKKEFILTQATMKKWAKSPILDGTRKHLYKIGISDKEMQNMTQLDAYYMIENLKKENI